MGFYADHILPHLVRLACGSTAPERERRRIVPSAHGRVLEIGLGPGLNLPHYNPKAIEILFALEPSSAMWKLAERKTKSLPFEVRPLEAPAESIPLDDASVDSVVMTFTLCTIPNPRAALAEIRRVLRPDGQLLFAEHGRAPDEKVLKWQTRLTPMWSRLGGGCHLDRPIAGLIEESGFNLVDIEEGYAPGWKPVAYHYRGRAEPGAPAAP